MFNYLFHTIIICYHVYLFYYHSTEIINNIIFVQYFLPIVFITKFLNLFKSKFCVEVSPILIAIFGGIPACCILVSSFISSCCISKIVWSGTSCCFSDSPFGSNCLNLVISFFSDIFLYFFTTLLAFFKQFF